MQAMPSQSESAPEHRLQRVIELRCRQEILQRWLAGDLLTDALRPSLRAMLHEVEEQLEAVCGRLD
jgi:hypothetical protein